MPEDEDTLTDISSPLHLRELWWIPAALMDGLLVCIPSRERHSDLLNPQFKQQCVLHLALKGNGRSHSDWFNACNIQNTTDYAQFYQQKWNRTHPTCTCARHFGSCAVDHLNRVCRCVAHCALHMLPYLPKLIRMFVIDYILQVLLHNTAQCSRRVPLGPLG